MMVLAVNNFGRVMMLERTWAPVVREDIRRGHPSSTVTGEEPAEELPGQGSSLCKGPVMAAGQCAQATQWESLGRWVRRQGRRGCAWPPQTRRVWLPTEE